jgi:Zn-dependent protease
MGRSWKLGELSGIGIFVHWTFFLLPAWLLMQIAWQGAGLAAMGLVLLMIGAIFACIVAHELGHALMARRFGVRTRDIILLPIGGVARLERMPRQPWQELLVALAGPFVNVVIAASIWVGLGLGYRVWGIPGWSFDGSAFVTNLFWFNLIMVAFNMIPAFPLDGGRVLRALLAMVVDRMSATRIAGTVGQVFGVLFIVMGLFGNLGLALIGLFVLVAARSEIAMAIAEAAVGQSVFLYEEPNAETGGEVETRIALSAEATVAQVVPNVMMRRNQNVFPVVASRMIVGMVERSDLLRALADGYGTWRIRQLMGSAYRQ